MQPYKLRYRSITNLYYGSQKINQLIQLYKHNTSRDGTHKQAGGQSVDAALLVEELIEFLHYSYS